MVFTNECKAVIAPLLETVSGARTALEKHVAMLEQVQ